MPNYDMGRPATPEEELAFRQRLLEAVGKTGPLASHMASVGKMNPQVAGVDFLPFQADYSADGVISNKTTTQKTQAAYWSELYAISAYVQAPLTNPEVLPAISFNLKDREHPGDMWSGNLVFASFVGADSGNGLVLFPRGLYLFAPASDVEVTWFADTTLYSGKSAKRCGVALHFNTWAVG